jgi:peptide/nickel transport system permease protein
MSDQIERNLRGPLLEVRDLSVTFSVRRGVAVSAIRAVRGVSFSLARGSVLGIVGESGSGKSVTTSAIPGLLPPYAEIQGSIAFDGAELAGLGARELRAYRGKRIGMIFQEPGRSNDPLQNIGSVFFETFRNAEPRITRAEARARAIALLEEVGLPNASERLGNFPHQFSGGQLQRIGIALALAQGCELLIADEPTTALDVTIQAQIIALLKGIRASRGLSIIFISHNIDLVAEISDDILVMYGGLVMESGPASEVVSSPEHPYSRALLAAAPRFGGHYTEERLLSIPGKVPDPEDVGLGCPFAPRCTEATDECRATLPELRVMGSGVAGNDTGASGTGVQPRAVRCFRHPEGKA